MSERKRREARRAASRAAEASKSLPTARPAAPRSTFRVAQAQRQLAVDLPGIVRNRQAERRQAVQPRLVALDAQPVGQAEAKRTPSRAVQSTRPNQPKLDKGDLHLKCRPKSNKPASGGGSGRSFVPWGNC